MRISALRSKIVFGATISIVIVVFICIGIESIVAWRTKRLFESYSIEPGGFRGHFGRDVLRVNFKDGGCVDIYDVGHSFAVQFEGVSGDIQYFGVYNHDLLGTYRIIWNGCIYERMRGDLLVADLSEGDIESFATLSACLKTSSDWKRFKKECKAYHHMLLFLDLLKMAEELSLP